MNLPLETFRRFKLKCMDLWSGNQSVENEVSTPGMDLFVFSRPYQSEKQGGDVYHVSLCAGGIVTRMILADVSGHGAAIGVTSRTLGALMRRYMNSKDQTRLVSQLNREFTRLTRNERFATAIVATYLNSQNRLTLCNAGHPRPLWYREASSSWSVIDQEIVLSGGAANLPLGCAESTEYQQFELPVADGDMLLLYTDAVTEARGADDQMLEQSGLLRLVSEIDTENVRDFGRELLQKLNDYCCSLPAEDLTIFVLKFAIGLRRSPGVREKLNAYAKLLGLKSTTTTRSAICNEIGKNFDHACDLES